MAASLSDILTAAKNAVVAINNGVASYLNVRGVQNFTGVTTATVIYGGAGRLGALSVTSGTGGGMVYDAKVVTDTTRPLCVVPSSTGVYPIDLPFNNGLLVIPGTSTSVSGSYSTGAPVGFPT